MRMNELTHHGVKGMKWGVRRYQYADGSLTPAGRKRYQNTDSYAEKVSNILGMKVKEAVASTVGLLGRYGSAKVSDAQSYVVRKTNDYLRR